jgi:hypothetical protein
VLLGTVGGSLLGGATSLLISGDNEQVGLSLTALGALSGFWLTCRALAGEVEADDSDITWDIFLAPRQRSGVPHAPFPFAICRYRF